MGWGLAFPKTKGMVVPSDHPLASKRWKIGDEIGDALDGVTPLCTSYAKSRGG